MSREEIITWGAGIAGVLAVVQLVRDSPSRGAWFVHLYIRWVGYLLLFAALYFVGYLIGWLP